MSKKHRISIEDFARYEAHLPEIIKRRCLLTSITENQRVLEAAQAFKNGDLALVGRLMNRSHASMRDDFEIRCAELDALDALTENSEGVYRGCAINLVRRESNAAFAEHIERE